MKWFKKLVLQVVSKWARIINAWRIEVDGNIHVGKNVQIHPSARLETRFGGKISIGKNTKIWEHVLIYSYGGNIEIGENCDINPFTVIYGHGNTKIGNDVLIAAHCLIIPANHNFIDHTKLIREQGLTKKGIEIEDNVWLAHSCTILDGVKIGNGAIVAAGTVVNKSVDKNLVVGGVPFRIIKNRNEI
jgi:acetyltransferase-like isoleucine patch superfamily enzyme